MKIPNLALALVLTPLGLFAGPDRTPVDQVVQAPAVRGVAPFNTVDDGGFEAGTPNPVWAEASTNFGTPLCTIGSCGAGGGSGPHAGTYWAWFGGIAAPETGSVAQPIQITNGLPATIDFFLEIPVASGNGVDFLELQLDGTPVWSVLENAPGFMTYAPVSVDISAYADGAAHTLTFFSTITGSATTNFFVDDVSLNLPIFGDGFETGDTSAWSGTQP
jgi:hypothetical protein